MSDTCNNPPSPEAYFTDARLGDSIYSVPLDDGLAAPPPPDDILLKEDGFAILQENGDFILLE